MFPPTCLNPVEEEFLLASHIAPYPTAGGPFGGLIFDHGKFKEASMTEFEPDPLKVKLL